MRYQSKLVGDLHKLYGLNDINRGRQIRPCGTQHVLLFDCAEASVGNVADGQEEMQRKDIEPIATKFGELFSPALSRLLDNLPLVGDVQVHIVPWLDPDANTPQKATPNLHCWLHTVKHLAFDYSKKSLRVESQVRRGYKELVSKYKVDSCAGPGGTRDAIYLFGDAEGARSANAVARIIANVGILQHIFWDDEGDVIIKIGLLSVRQDWEFYSVTRGWDTRVELLGLWTDDGALPCLTPIRDPSGIVNVVKYSRSPCKHCGQYVTDITDGSRRGACASYTLVSKLREMFSLAVDAAASPTTDDAVNNQCALHD